MGHENVGNDRCWNATSETSWSGTRDSNAIKDILTGLTSLTISTKTGRKHQLRVHMKSIGHPIFNDSAYGGGAKYAKSFHIKYTQLINRLLKTIPRVSLHARKIEILHPESEKWMCFEAPLPLDLIRALEILKSENS